MCCRFERIVDLPVEAAAYDGCVGEGVDFCQEPHNVDDDDVGKGCLDAGEPMAAGRLQALSGDFGFELCE
jgi:hypothetical protein